MEEPFIARRSKRHRSQFAFLYCLSAGRDLSASASRSPFSLVFCLEVPNSGTRWIGTLSPSPNIPWVTSTELRAQCLPAKAVSLGEHQDEPGPRSKFFAVPSFQFPPSSLQPSWPKGNAVSQRTRSSTGVGWAG